MATKAQESVAMSQMKRFTDDEQRSIEQAYQLARRAHAGQKRKSGESYIAHPVAVAQILYAWQLDATTVEAGLLHDVVEDTDVDLPQLEESFGQDVARIVDGVTKIGQLRESRVELESARSVENIRKLLVAMAKDVRVILVKLADRLHNMRTLKSLARDKQLRIARETLDVYAPIANRLGMGDVKAELEDLAFEILEPEKYRLLKKESAPKVARAKAALEEVVAALRSELKSQNIAAEIEFRIKHLYSLHRKLAKYDHDFTRIRDLIAVRIITDSLEECYRVLGIIHSMYPPLPHYIKDYIAVPKPNGYQSIHTTVLGNQDIFEVQIRTKEMHEYAEHGLAAHFHYDGQKNTQAYVSGSVPALTKKYKWIQNLLDWQEQLTNEKNLQEGFKLDLFKERIFVFSPKGDLYDLPRGATPVDFAFQVHTQLGLSCRGAKVNDRIVPLDQPLENRDIVEIFAFSKDPKPSRDWLGFVVTAKARSQIKNWLLLADRSAEEQQGRDLVDEYLIQHGHGKWQSYKLGLRKDILKRLRLEDEPSLFVAIGEGTLQPSEVLRELMYRPALIRKQPTLVTNLMRRARTARPVPLIPGIERQHVSRAGCCAPRYPEHIVGFVSRMGVFRIHLENCPEIATQRERCVPAYWYYDSSDRIRVQGDMQMTAGILRAISQHLHAYDAHANSLKETLQDDTVQFDVLLSLVRMDKLTSLVRALRRVPGVTSVEHTVHSRR
ncbi:MAG: diphosphokinase / guanosine-3,5-bis(diphosphate) 3-diphosphatase [Patescibacteria group bacterium]|nr:diphosphokinase / guanosine-3,5-bis(diphosphate) 3-diphosphatase [Patescibacteria group bacterium]